MSFKILLDSEVFYVGSNIKGTFCCKLDFNKSVKGIRVEITGKEYTTYKKKKPQPESGKQSNGVQYMAAYEFLKCDVLLFKEGGIAAGSYEFKFNIKLPDVIPSSYSGPYGYVKYSIAGVFEGPQKTDYCDKTDFAVLNLTDINTLPYSFYKPITFSDEKTFTSHLCRREIVTLQMILEKQAFFLGEAAKVEIKIINTSKVSPKYIKLELLQTITASVPISQDMTQVENTVLERREIKTDHRPAGDSYIINLQIPFDLNVYNFSGSEFWKAAYTIRATCVFADEQGNIFVEMSPTVGILPIDKMPDISINSLNH